MKRGKDVLTKAQDDLEMAAKAVTEADKAILKKLGRDPSFETYITLALSRLRPFLTYFVHLGPEQVRFIIITLQNFEATHSLISHSSSKGMAHRLLH